MMTATRSRMLTDFVRDLHLRLDAPMPSQIKASHERVNLIRSCCEPAPKAKILRFSKEKKFQAA